MLLHSAEPRQSGLKKLRYNPLCDADEESSTDVLSEELDVINLEVGGQTGSDESSFKMSESESENETSVFAC
jgi:hypothetical protein